MTESPWDCLGILVTLGPLAKMGKGIPDHAVAASPAVMYVEGADDDVIHKLDGNSGSIVDVHLVAAPIDGPWAAVPGGVVVLDPDDVTGSNFWGDLNPNLGEVVSSYRFNAIDVEVDVVVVDVKALFSSVKFDDDELVGCVAVKGGVREAEELAFATVKGGVREAEELAFATDRGVVVWGD